MGLLELEGIRTRRPSVSRVHDRHTSPDEPPPASDLPDGLKIVLCIVFLAFSVVAWKAAVSSELLVLYYVLFSIPNYVCGEYLGGKFFSRELGMRISDKYFSVGRIFVGVLITLLMLAAIYGLAALTLLF